MPTLRARTSSFPYLCTDVKTTRDWQQLLVHCGFRATVQGKGYSSTSPLSHPLNLQSLHCPTHSSIYNHSIVLPIPQFTITPLPRPLINLQSLHCPAHSSIYNYSTAPPTRYKITTAPPTPQFTITPLLCPLLNLHSLHCPAHSIYNHSIAPPTPQFTITPLPRPLINLQSLHCPAHQCSQ